MSRQPLSTSPSSRAQFFRGRPREPRTGDAAADFAAVEEVLNNTLDDAWWVFLDRTLNAPVGRVDVDFLLAHRTLGVAILVLGNPPEPRPDVVLRSYLQTGGFFTEIKGGLAIRLIDLCKLESDEEVLPALEAAFAEGERTTLVDPDWAEALADRLTVPEDLSAQSLPSSIETDRPAEPPPAAAQKPEPIAAVEAMPRPTPPPPPRIEVPPHRLASPSRANLPSSPPPRRGPSRAAFVGGIGCLLGILATVAFTHQAAVEELAETWLPAEWHSYLPAETKAEIHRDVLAQPPHASVQPLILPEITTVPPPPSLEPDKPLETAIVPPSLPQNQAAAPSHQDVATVLPPALPARPQTEAAAPRIEDPKPPTQHRPVRQKRVSEPVPEPLPTAAIPHGDTRPPIDAAELPPLDTPLGPPPSGWR
jgi:hypothetical protein